MWAGFLTLKYKERFELKSNPSFIAFLCNKCEICCKVTRLRWTTVQNEGRTPCLFSKTFIFRPVGVLLNLNEIRVCVLSGASVWYRPYRTVYDKWWKRGVRSQPLSWYILMRRNASDWDESIGRLHARISLLPIAILILYMYTSIIHTL